MRKTSLTHPLMIAAVSAGPAHGRIGITLCPGKYDPCAQSGYWDRDLALDLDAIRAWGAAAVVTLVQPHELRLLRVERLGEEVCHRGMAWFHLPITDGSRPDETFEQQWDDAGKALCTLLRGGQDIVIHCRGGLGRAGTIGARLLIEIGMQPPIAITRVRAARPGAIETDKQAEYVLGLGRRRGRDKENGMDWFERLTGFREAGYEATRAQLAVEDGKLISRANGARYEIGGLELVALETLRERARSAGLRPGRLKVRVVTGDVRRLHRSPENAGALFQVASQFNLLEMTSPDMTPEQGVTRYQNDPTQGPACAIAAGAATIYRNYFVPMGEDHGQTARRQLDGLADLGKALSRATKLPVCDLWTMQNGYALATRTGLDAIACYLQTLSTDQIDCLRGKLCIGLHQDVEVTEAPGPNRPRVSQSFCSALPVAYSDVPPAQWEPFAMLVLEAAYEATLWAGVRNAQRHVSHVVFLTLLGGGAFGNPGRWTHGAIRRALRLMSAYDLDVRLVSFGAPSPEVEAIAEEFRGI